LFLFVIIVSNHFVQVNKCILSFYLCEQAMNLTPYKGVGKPSCTKAVNVMYDGANIHLKQGGLILVNGREVTSLPVAVAGVRIRPASSMFVIGPYLSLIPSQLNYHAIGK
jgi:hypothetical protein